MTANVGKIPNVKKIEYWQLTLRGSLLEHLLQILSWFYRADTGTLKETFQPIGRKLQGIVSLFVHRRSSYSSHHHSLMRLVGFGSSHPCLCHYSSLFDDFVPHSYMHCSLLVHFRYRIRVAVDDHWLQNMMTTTHGRASPLLVGAAQGEKGARLPVRIR